MCGRVFQRMSMTRLLQLSRSGVVRNRGAYYPSANVCPTNFIPAVREFSSSKGEEESLERACEEHPGFEAGITYQYVEMSKDERVEGNSRGFQRELAFLKWGMETPFQFLINARVEEIHEKKTFRKIVQDNRCAVLVEGYYEWTPSKKPYAFKPKSADHLFLAAFYTDKNTIVLLTREVCDYLGDVHHRMPIFLEEDEIDIWLDSKSHKFSAILDRIILNEKKKIWRDIDHYPIAPYLNDIKNKSDKCLMTLDDFEQEKRRGGLHKFFKPKTAAEPDGGSSPNKENRLSSADHKTKEPRILDNNKLLKHYDDSKAISKEPHSPSHKSIMKSQASPLKRDMIYSISSVKKRKDAEDLMQADTWISKSVRAKKSVIDKTDPRLQDALSEFMQKK